MFSPGHLVLSRISAKRLSSSAGVYFLLFILALWASYGRRTPLSRRLRIVTIFLFFNLTAHLIARSLQFSRARIMFPEPNESLVWSIPLVFIGKCHHYNFAGVCADGLLAWRFYIIYDQRKWALYIPMTLVILNSLLCLSADVQHLFAYKSYDLYEQVLLRVTLNITVSWGWIMFVTNTFLTGGIIGRIFLVARRSGHVDVYRTVLRACIESALVTWIGLLLYEVCTLAPTGHVETTLDAGYVMLCVLPAFFGVSQCLIVVRIAVANEFAESRGTSGATSRMPSFVLPSGMETFDVSNGKFTCDYPLTTVEEHPSSPFPRTPSPIAESV